LVCRADGTDALTAEAFIRGKRREARVLYASGLSRSRYRAIDPGHAMDTRTWTAS
jgi:hypothetical protein